MSEKYDKRWLALLLLALLVSLLGARFNDQRDQQLLTAEQSRDLIEQQRGNDQFVILDVRTAQEFMQGHIDGAVSIDFYAPGFEEVLRGLDKDKTYLVYCRSGNRSAQTLSIGEKLGFRRMHHMSSGIVEWQAKGYPLVGGR